MNELKVIDNNQYIFVFRENLILKENLKQYMSAVQMLKLNGERNNTTSTPPPDRDQESRHFESKLVQVLFFSYSKLFIIIILSSLALGC